MHKNLISKYIYFVNNKTIGYSGIFLLENITVCIF